MNSIIRYIAILSIWIGIFLYAFKREKPIININIFTDKRCKKYSKLYGKLTKIPIMGTDISNIKRRLYINKYDNENVLRTKSILYYLSSWAFCITIFCISCCFYQDMYLKVVFMVICIYLRVVFIDLVVGNDTKLLEELVEFIKDLKQQFSAKNSIHVAFNEAIKLAGKTMKIHAKNMSESIKSKKDIKMYCNKSPNRFLKIVGIYTYLTSEMGDAFIDGKSTFTNNMNYIMRNVKLEVDSRNNLKYWLKFISIITIVPLMFFRPIENWSLGIFEQARFFYKSSLNIIAIFITIMISLSCFITVREIEKHTDKQAKLVLKKKYWEASLLKVTVIRKIVKLFMPKPSTKEYIKTKNLIIDSGSNLKIEWLYLRKLLITLVVFISTMISIIGLQKYNIQNVLDNNSYLFIESQEYLIVNHKELEITQLDKELLEKFRSEYPSNEELTREVKSKGITDQKDINSTVNRIQGKLEFIQYEHFGVIDILISILIAIGASYIPDIKLKLDKKMRKIDMDSEIFEFYTIMLLLRYHERTSIEMILEWMEDFSYVFKDPIRKCRNNLRKDVIGSLKILKEDCKYKPFGRLVDDLILAEKLKIVDAFESLESERQFFETEQKELNERIVNEKKELADLLGVIPTLTIVTIYLLLPLMWASKIQFNSVFQNLQE